MATDKRAVPSPVKAGQSVSHDIRKIANGFIIRTSTSDDKGNYKSTETYSPTAPKVSTNVESAQPAARKK